MATERTSFMGATIPSEIKATVGLINDGKVDQKACRKVLEAVLQYQTTGAVADPLSFEQEPLSTLFTGLHYILRAAIKTKVSNENFVSDLNEIKIPPQLAQDIGRILSKGRPVIESTALTNRIQFPTLSNLRWRVDVVISTSSMSRVLTPVILLEITASSGKSSLLEVPLEQFHELRYNVAKVLKDMEELEQNPILKIDK